MALKQVVTVPPIPGHWWSNGEPFSILGNSQNWTDVSVTVRAAIVPPSGAIVPPPGTSTIPASSTPPSVPAPAFVRVCGRISTFQPHGQPPQGYCLVVDNNLDWFLVAGGKAGPANRDLMTVSEVDDARFKPHKVSDLMLNDLRLIWDILGSDVDKMDLMLEYLQWLRVMQLLIWVSDYAKGAIVQGETAAKGPCEEHSPPSCSGIL